VRFAFLLIITGFLSANANAQSRHNLNDSYQTDKAYCEDRYQQRIRQLEDWEARMNSRGPSRIRPINSRDTLENQRSGCLKNIEREYENRNGSLQNRRTKN
jgi:hypothetical protein